MQITITPQCHTFWINTSNLAVDMLVSTGIVMAEWTYPQYDEMILIYAEYQMNASATEKFIENISLGIEIQCMKLL